MIGGSLRTRRCNMTAQAFFIISGKLLDQRLVRIVTGDAGDARVALSPALTGFEAIYGKARVLDAVIPQSVDVPPTAMASAAEINRRGRRKPSGIECHARVLNCARARGSYVCRTWAVTTLA